MSRAKIFGSDIKPGRLTGSIVCVTWFTVSKLRINYTLTGRGWALVEIRDNDAMVEAPASYLYDSLGNLAELAWNIKSGSVSGQASFFDEPGEIQFVLEADGERLRYEVREFADYASWRMGSGKFSVLMSGTTTAERCVHQITELLWKIHEEHGVAGYQATWVKHEFPTEHYRKLIGR